MANPHVGIAGLETFRSRTAEIASSWGEISLRLQRLGWMRRRTSLASILMWRSSSGQPRDLGELTVREKIDFALLSGLVADVLPKDRVSLCLDGRRALNWDGRRAPKRQRCDDDEALCLVADVLPRDRVSLGLDGRRATEM